MFILETKFVIAHKNQQKQKAISGYSYYHVKHIAINLFKHFAWGFTEDSFSIPLWFNGAKYALSFHIYDSKLISS